MRSSLFVIALAGCAAPIDPSVDGADAGALAFSINEQDAILDVANHATLAELDDDVPLDSRAANNIVAHRDGPDGLVGSADDDLFGSIDELDAVPWVGEAALQALRDYADSLGMIEPDGELGYTAQEVEDALRVANTASVDTLDIDVGLDVRAAEGIVATRAGLDGVEGTADDAPFTRLAAVDAVPYVGTSALDKLVAYGGLHAVAPADGCLLLSEYLEGSGTYNKAIEVYNCGAQPLELAGWGVCIVRNDDTACTTSRTFGAGTLEAGDVHTACRKDTPNWYDPYPQLTDSCDEEMSLLTFSGNDRIVIFEDLDGDGAYTEGADRVADMLGRFGWVPAWEIWSDVTLRRCHLEPWTDTGFYEHTDWFTEHSDMDFTGLGLPPVSGCP